MFHFTYFLLQFSLFGLGAKSQILSPVAPPGRKNWLLFSVRDMSGASETHVLLSFLWSIFCKWPVITVTLQTLKILAQKYMTNNIFYNSINEFI